MKVELNAKELETLDAALVVWQKQPQSDGFNMSIMETIFSGLARKEGEEPPKREYGERNPIMEKAEKESQNRERQVLLLRAKLAQASAVNSEHEVAQG